MAAGDLAAIGECEQFVLVRDRDAAATVLVAVHDTRLGPAHGGIPVVPDFVANAGALMVGATWHLTGQRLSASSLGAIAATAGELLDRAVAANAPPSLLAIALARERVKNRKVECPGPRS